MSYATTLLRQKLRALDAQPPGEPVPSPCNNVCRIDPDTGLCAGCLRDIDEVAGWGGFSDEQKRGVWRRLGERVAAAAARKEQP